MTVRTKRQQELEELFNNSLEKRAKEAIDEVRIYMQATVKLPCFNEEGKSVVWGANKNMMAIAEHFAQIAEMWITMIWLQGNSELEYTLRTELKAAKKEGRYAIS